MGFYSGWEMRTMAFFVQALLTTPTIDYLERNYGRYEYSQIKWSIHPT